MIYDPLINFKCQICYHIILDFFGFVKVSAFVFLTYCSSFQHMLPQKPAPPSLHEPHFSESFCLLLICRYTWNPFSSCPKRVEFSIVITPSITLPINWGRIKVSKFYSIFLSRNMLEIYNFALILL